MKIVCLSLSLCLLVALCMGQKTTSAKTGNMSWYFGGGPTFSKFTGDYPDAEFLVGAQVALGTSIPLSGNFSLVPELNVGMQGSRVNIPTTDYSYRLWYLNLPVVARYQFAQSGFFAETGPQIGLLLDATRKIGEDKEDRTEEFENFSFNWNVGLGYQLKNGLVINARVAPGLNVIEKNETYKTKQFTSALRVLFNF